MYKHYIIIDDRNLIIDRFCDGAQYGKDTTGAIMIREDDSYQFRLMADGDENPQCLTPDGVPMYRYNKSKNEIVRRSDAEIQADIDALPKPEPIQSITYSDYLNLCMAVAMLYESQLEAKK